ncbi:MAG: right-handed parallel beta-helix repeat-containing protein [Phycisphaerae bacterium]
MKGKLLIAICLLAVSATIGCGRKNITVTNAEELVQAIGSNRTIHLKPGDYDLYKLRLGKMTHVVKDGLEEDANVTFRDVENLTLVGEGDEPVEIIASNPLVYPLNFQRAKNVGLRNLRIGHEPQGSCAGGVIWMQDADGVEIDDCDLYGCGTEGLTLTNVRNATVRKSVIRDCSYGILTLEQCRNIRFIQSDFRDNEQYHGLVIRDSSDVLFEKCLVSDNKVVDYQGNPRPLLSISSSSEVRFDGCLFRDNRAKILGTGGSPVEMVDCRFEGKTTPAEPDKGDEAQVAPPTPKQEPVKPAESQPSARSYVIAEGDSFWKIAKKVYGNGRYWPLIAKANPGVDPTKLQVGQTLTIPPKPKAD